MDDTLWAFFHFGKIAFLFLVIIRSFGENYSLSAQEGWKYSPFPVSNPAKITLWHRVHNNSTGGATRPSSIAS